MKRELVKCLRTVTLLAMFSRDLSTISNIQSCLKSMTIMEPDLVLQPVLERAIPALDTLVEVSVDQSIRLRSNDRQCFLTDAAYTCAYQSFRSGSSKSGIS